MIQSANLGFPRIGAKRELKKATEAFWKGRIDAQALSAAGAELRARHRRLIEPYSSYWLTLRRRSAKRCRIPDSPVALSCRQVVLEDEHRGLRLAMERQTARASDHTAQARYRRAQQPPVPRPYEELYVAHSRRARRWATYCSRRRRVSGFGNGPPASASNTTGTSPTAPA